MPEPEQANLSKLLSALAVGARAVHSLPVNDDFDYEATFPEFLALKEAGNSDLIHVLSLALQQDLDQDDPGVWEACADACDYLLEQTEVYLSSERLELTHWSSTARQHAQSAHGRMMDGIVDMEKPQVTHRIVLDNDRTSPFVPPGIPAEALVPGRAKDTRYGASPDVSFLGEGLVGPTSFVPHQKREQILALNCTYRAPPQKPKPIDKGDLENSPHTWVETVDQLAALAKKLESVTQVAVDLEAHSYRSFAGIVCLMQMTIETKHEGRQDYLVDTLALWHSIRSYLTPVFSNPNIIKVMHGADSDMSWLQRDFGIYVVNLLDTGRASRLLKLSSFGLAYLLKTYTGVDADKTHQLSDWRQRPLPESMLVYAKMDTHYLLDIAQHLLWDIEHHSSPEVTLDKLFQDSQLVTLIRYDKEVFRVNGYKSLLHHKRTKSELSETQEKVLQALYDWRDICARDCDESPHFVCPNKSLLRLALACPTTVSALLSLLNPIPPLVMQFAQAILERVSNILRAGPPSSAFFKPAEPDDTEEARASPRGLLSPVLGTEALYKQAGWMTPGVNDAIQTSTEEEDADDSRPTSTTKPKKLLLVDDGNKEYRASGFTSHSLAMGGLRGRTVDGLGAANGLSPDQVKEASEHAQRSAHNVRKAIGETNLLGLISPATDVEDDDDEEREEEEDDKENEDSETEFEIPRSMREIYKVSNRNRRNKKATSPQTVERDVVQGSKMEVDTVEGAEKILAARGAAYFDSSSKRQKHDEEDAANQVSQEEDVAFMQQIGWVKDKEEAEMLKPRPRGDSEDFDNDEGKSEKEVVKPFDYSTVGNIGVYNPSAPPAANPFFAGAAVAGAGFNQGSSGPKTKRGGKGKSSRGGRQERPQKNDGRSFVYKKK